MKASSSIFKSLDILTVSGSGRRVPIQQSEEAKNVIRRSWLVYWEAAERAQWEASRRV